MTSRLRKPEASRRNASLAPALIGRGELLHRVCFSLEKISPASTRDGPNAPLPPAHCALIAPPSGLARPRTLQRVCFSLEKISPASTRDGPNAPLPPAHCALIAPPSGLARPRTLQRVCFSLE